MKAIKKFKSVYALMAATMLLLTACDKQLDQENPNAVSTELFWRTEGDALANLYGVFDALQVTELAGQRYIELDHVSDIAASNGGGVWADIESSTHSPASQRVTARWRAYYEVVQRANVVIKNVGGMPAGSISDAARKRIIAEATFLRAFIYNDLVTLWGDVPFYTEPVEPFTPGKARSTKASIVEAMIADLTTSVIPSLPVSVSAGERGRITADAAKALLGKIYLYNQRWTDAATTLKQIIDGGRYSLYPNYADLFTLAGEYSSEVLWEVNFETGGVDNGETFSSRIDTNLAAIRPQAHWRPLDSMANSFLAVDGRPITTNATYGATSPFYIPTSNLSGRYFNRDPRLKANLFTFADVLPSGRPLWDFPTKNSFTALNNFGVKKWFTITPVQYNGGPQNLYMIRYADVLLMYAEARNEEAASPDATVYSAVNSIRRRLKISEYLSGGRPNPTGTVTATPAGEGLSLNITSTMFLKRVNMTIPAAASGTATISLRNTSGTVVNSTTATIAAATGTANRVVTVPVLFTIQPGTYTLVLTAPFAVLKENTAAYPIALFGAGSITGGTPTAANYNYFYNLQYDLPNSTVTMPDYPAGLSQAQMRQMIRDERRWELAFEGKRLYDLLRWRTAGPIFSTIGGNKRWNDPRDYLWPYPQTEMDNNPAMKAGGQNPGW